MARAFYSPMGDPTYANAAASIAEALFPSQRTRAAGQMAGAQFRGQQLGNEQTALENAALSDQNAAWAAGPEGTGMTPELFARARLARDKATPTNLADAVAKDLEMTFRQGARDAALRGDYTAANAELFGVARGPQAVNKIDGGYRLNPLEEGGSLDATGKTQAEISLAGARAAAAGAAGRASDARASYYNERTTNPAKFMSPTKGPAAGEVSPSEVKAMDDILGYYFPGAVPDEDGGTLAAVVDEGLRNEVLTRATELFTQTRNAQTAVNMAVQELMEVIPGKPGKDGFLLDTPGVAPVVRRKVGDVPTVGQAPGGMPAMTPPPAPAAPAPAPAAAAPAPAAPAAPRTIPKIPPSQWEAAIAAANKAIQNGADPEAVRKRLIDAGVQLQE